MSQEYEYKFVRLGEGWLEARKEGKEEYQTAVHAHARDGWRLVQVFGSSCAQMTVKPILDGFRNHGGAG